MNIVININIIANINIIIVINILFQSSADGNLTVSSVMLKPTRRHSGQVVTCRVMTIYDDYDDNDEDNDNHDDNHDNYD